MKKLMLLVSLAVICFSIGCNDSEKVEFSYTYPDGYSVKTLEAQTDILRQAFPELSLGMGVVEHVKYLVEFQGKTKLPAGAEGFFIIPRWQKVAATYGEALEKVLALIAESRRFYNYRQGQLGEKQLRQSVRTSKKLAKLAEDQPGDFFIIPAQVGMKYRDKPVSQARENFRDNEFGLDAFTVACILLTHSERLVDYDDLWIDCAGDEYSSGADGQFGYAPYFYFDDGMLRFGSRFVGNAFDFCGSASGFLPL